MTKRKHPERTPAQIEAVGRMSPEDFAALVPFYLTAELDAAAQRLDDARRVAAGRCPPPTNRGGKSEERSETVKLVLEGGVIKEVPQRRGYGGNSAFIDWVNFTIGEETIGNGVDAPVIRHALINGKVTEVVEGSDKEFPVTPDQVMICLSNRLHSILGFGITSKREMGANFYQESWVIGADWGMVCYGGQRQTIMVTINGTGCSAAKEGWEARLMAFLEKAQRARITRLDLAHDIIHPLHGPCQPGEWLSYSVDQADRDHTAGLFNCGGRNPDCEHRGNWKNPNGKGRTLNIGNRTNGKFCRVYEKGRQLGDKTSDWVRIEVEFKSVDRVIPFDALIRPGEYLAAAYPAFVWVNDHQERILTTQKVVEKTVAKAFDWIRHQCGPSIKEMVELFGVEYFLSRVSRDGSPAWSKVPCFLLSPPAIHQQGREVPRINLNAAATAW